MINKIVKFSTAALLITGLSSVAFADSRTQTIDYTVPYDGGTGDYGNQSNYPQQRASRVQINDQIDNDSMFGNHSQEDSNYYGDGETPKARAFFGVTGGNNLGLSQMRYTVDKDKAWYASKDVALDTWKTYKIGAIVGFPLGAGLGVELEGMYNSLPLKYNNDDKGKAPLTPLSILSGVASLAWELDTPLGIAPIIAVGAGIATQNYTSVVKGASGAADVSTTAAYWAPIGQAKIGLAYNFGDTAPLLIRVDYEARYIANKLWSKATSSNTDKQDDKKTDAILPDLFSHGPRLTLAFKLTN